MHLPVLRKRAPAVVRATKRTDGGAGNSGLQAFQTDCALSGPSPSRHREPGLLRRCRGGLVMPTRGRHPHNTLKGVAARQARRGRHADGDACCISSGAISGARRCSQGSRLPGTPPTPRRAETPAGVDPALPRLLMQVAEEVSVNDYCCSRWMVTNPLVTPYVHNHASRRSLVASPLTAKT